MTVEQKKKLNVFKVHLCAIPTFSLYDQTYALTIAVLTAYNDRYLNIMAYLSCNKKENYYVDLLLSKTYFKSLSSSSNSSKYKEPHRQALLPLMTII